MPLKCLRMALKGVFAPLDGKIPFYRAKGPYRASESYF